MRKSGVIVFAGLLALAMQVQAEQQVDGLPNATPAPEAPEKKAIIRKEPDTASILTVSVENDIFSGTDNHYTNGIRLAYVPGENQQPAFLEKTIGQLPIFSPEGHKRYQFSVGQSMFTPSDITISALQPDDRPYAGWLYGSVGVVSDTGYELDNLQLTLGVVGPASLAAETQDFVHRVIHTRRPKGWDNQLHNEPGFIITYEHKWRGLYEFSPFGLGIDVTPSIGAAAGNVDTHASIGGTVRLGYDLPSDYGPPLIRPSLPGSDFFVPTKDFGWYFFAGVEGRAVARNIFLDGNTFRDSHNIDKYPLVATFQGGLAMTFGGTRIAYTHLLRTREFQGQKKNDSYGAFTISQRF